MKYFIITGTSRGIGEALAFRLLSPDHTLFCISRNGNSALTEKALKKSCALFYLKFNLAGPGNIQALMDDIFNHIFEPDGIYLINNAGVIKPVKPSGSADDGDFIDRKKFIDYQKQGNLLAPPVVAAALERLLLGDNFNHGGIIDIRDPH